jgi:hypothetical protein
MPEAGSVLLGGGATWPLPFLVHVRAESMKKVFEDSRRSDAAISSALASLIFSRYSLWVEKDLDGHFGKPRPFPFREAPYRLHWRTHGKQSARWRRRLGVSWSWLHASICRCLLASTYED